MVMCYDDNGNWDCKDCVDCMDCAVCNDCHNCTDSDYCTDCVNCTDCVGCEGLTDCHGYVDNEPRVRGAVVYSLFSDGGGTGYGIFSSYATIAKYIAIQSDLVESEVLAELEAEGEYKGYYVVASELDCPRCFDV